MAFFTYFDFLGMPGRISVEAIASTVIIVGSTSHCDSFKAVVLKAKVTVTFSGRCVLNH